jgi:NADH-quinone oxidoreductase subunit N
MPFPPVKDLVSIVPQLIIAGVAMVVLLLDAIWPRISKRFLAHLSVLGLLAAGIVTVATWPKGTPKTVLQDMVVLDGYTAFFTLVFVVGGILSIWLSINFLETEGADHGEYYTLLLLTIMGGLVMTASVNLICIFIGLEILSIALYILAGYQTERRESDESAMKYFLLGAFASAFFLYGIALVYGATGTININSIATFLRDAGASAAVAPGKNYLLLAGVGMLLVGFGFKVAVVPFHIWTPDVYQGAPTSVTAFMSVGAKIAGFAAFLRVITGGFADQNVQLQISAVLASIAALTMLVGNVVAVVQTNVKRMLAYSSIAHAGYMMAGLVAAVRPGGGFGVGGDARGDAVTAVLFYTLCYTVSNLGAFGVVLALRRRGEEIAEIKDFAGVASRYPGLAAMMTLFLLSLAGLPPTCGFFGKLLLIGALTKMNTPLVWLLVLFALTSVVSFYYYLNVVRVMYMEKLPEDAADRPVMNADWALKLALGVSAIATVALGLWAGGIVKVAQDVAQAFIGGGPFSAMQ